MLFEKELHIFILHRAMQIMLAFGRPGSGLRAAPFVYLEALPIVGSPTGKSRCGGQSLRSVFAFDMLITFQITDTHSSFEGLGSVPWTGEKSETTP